MVEDQQPQATCTGQEVRRDEVGVLRAHDLPWPPFAARISGDQFITVEFETGWVLTIWTALYLEGRRVIVFGGAGGTPIHTDAYRVAGLRLVFIHVEAEHFNVVSEIETQRVLDLQLFQRGLHFGTLQRNGLEDDEF